MTEIAARQALRVLFVEDNTDLREMTVEILQDEGLDVDAYATGEAAEAAFDPERYDLVLTDVSLPGMSGTELARRLLKRVPGLWVVFSSGYPLDHGLATFGPHVRSLAKPFEIDELHRLIGEMSAAADTGAPSP